MKSFLLRKSILLSTKDIWRNGLVSSRDLGRDIKVTTLCFFCKNTLYKNIEAQIVPKNKNKFRTSRSSDQDLLKIRTHQVDIRMH